MKISATFHGTTESTTLRESQKLPLSITIRRKSLIKTKMFVLMHGDLFVRTLCFWKLFSSLATNPFQ